MARSEFTVAELQAQGMLLGMWYDMDDHTFCKWNADPTKDAFFMDADTHEEVYGAPEPFADYMQDRHALVRAGQIGACDYLQYKEKILGYKRDNGAGAGADSYSGPDDTG